MKDIKIPFLPRIEEEPARKIAEAFLKRNGYLQEGANFMRLPINVEILAHRVGHPVEVFDDLQSKFDCKGTAYNNKERKRLEIYIDSDHYMNQANSAPFTIAEELAHIMIHSSIFTQIETPEDRAQLETNTRESTRRVIEKQAKCVASELLLPSILFHQYLTAWMQKNLKSILDDRPNDEDDLATFMARKIAAEIGLSEMIVKRAILRKLDTNILGDLTARFGIKYIKDVPRNASISG